MTGISSWRLTLRCLLAAAVWLSATRVQAAVFGRLTTDGQIRFETVGDLLINDSRKVRLAPESSPRVEPADAKSLERTETNQAGLLRGDGKGRVSRLNPDGSMDRVIPENFAFKMSIQPATTPIPLTIRIVKNKKDRDAAEVSPQEFYFYSADSDAEHAALRFVLDPKSFGSRDEQLRAMQGFAGSFEKTAVGTELGKNLEKQLTSSLNEFDGGGTYASLLEAQKLAHVASQSFPSEKGVTQASSELENRIRSTMAAKDTLLGLADIGDWATFRVAYRNIEVHQDSFPELKILHRRALEEETRTRCERARALILRHEDTVAMEELSEAARVDPANDEIPKLAESTRMLAAMADAKRVQTAHKALPKDSPEDRRFQRSLDYAKRAIQDHDYARAQAAISDAERENADAPQILLERAALAVAMNDMAHAIPLLDQYDRCVTEREDREKGDSVRNQALYELRKRREESKAAVENAMSAGDFSAAYKQSTAAIKIEPNDPDFLYAAGVSAAVLRQKTDAKRFLDSYLQNSDSLASDDTMRAQARKLLPMLDDAKPEQTGDARDWFSGMPVSTGVYYSPRSLAFQVPIESVAGFKVRVNYFRDDYGRLKSIRSEFEDEKGRQNYLQIATKRTRELPESLLGNFVFSYHRTLPGVRAVYTGMAPKDATDEDKVRIVQNEGKSFKVIDPAGNPLVALENNPWVDLKIVKQIMGPAATIVSGNSFFNPFIWDGVHYFTVRYDEQGRASSAKEWDIDNQVRFHWNGERLIEVAAYRGHDAEPYYRRTISYSGTNIQSEEYRSGAHGGRIKYQYSKDVLTGAKMEDGGVHDGKTWLVHMAEK